MKLPPKPAVESLATRSIAYVLMVSALLLGLAAAALAAPKQVTCGDSFAGKGTLTGNCSGQITIEKGVLKLNGFTITGTAVNAVSCTGRCKILGPGSIVGGGSDRGVFGEDGVKLIDVEISGHTSLGARSECCGGMKLRRANIHHNGGDGVLSSDVKASDSIISDNGLTGIVANFRGIRLKNTRVWDNGGDGCIAATDTPERARIKMNRGSVIGNGGFGVVAKSITVINSNVSGNALDSNCNVTGPCTDLASVTEPVVRGGDSICDTSLVIPENLVGPIPFGPSWGVCSLD